MVNAEERKRKRVTENGKGHGGWSCSADEAADVVAPLMRPQLEELLKSAIMKHADVLADVFKFLDADVSRRKLFVRGLAPETTRLGLHKTFAEFGDVENVAVPSMDKSTGRNKGFGFVTFRHVESAMKALKERSKQIDGRITACYLASEGPPSGAQQQQHQHQQPDSQPATFPSIAPGVVAPNSNPMTIGALAPVTAALNPGTDTVNLAGSLNTTLPSVPNPINTGVLQPALPHHRNNDDRRIYVSNVPQDMPASRMTEFFSQYGDIEEGPVGYDRLTGKSKGYALIIYKTVNATHKCLESQVKNVDGHQLFCKLAAEGLKQKQQYQQQQQLLQLQQQIQFQKQQLLQQQQQFLLQQQQAAAAIAAPSLKGASVAVPHDAALGVTGFQNSPPFLGSTASVPNRSSLAAPGLGNNAASFSALPYDSLSNLQHQSLSSLASLQHYSLLGRDPLPIIQSTSDLVSGSLGSVGSYASALRELGPYGSTTAGAAGSLYGTPQGASVAGVGTIPYGVPSLVSSFPPVSQPYLP